MEPQGLAYHSGQWHTKRMRIWPAAFLLCLGVATAAPAQTSLTLSVMGTDVTQPDQITASLTAQTTAPTAAAAQAALNRMMAKALATVRQVNGVEMLTGGYNVSEIDPANQGGKPQFEASQDLELTMPAPGGAPASSFTALTGQLQSQGLLLESLTPALSAKGQDTAQAAATIDGIHRLQAEAAAIAKTLGETIAGISSLTITGNQPGPMPIRMMAAMAPAPQVAPGPVTVNVGIDGVIMLKPPGP